MAALAHSARGWPRLVLQVHQLDEYGRSHVHGYGFVHLPLATGAHKLACKLWRPTGSERDEVTAFFLGNTPQLTNDELVYNAWSERWALVTVPSGVVAQNAKPFKRRQMTIPISMVAGKTMI